MLKPTEKVIARNATVFDLSTLKNN